MSEAVTYIALSPEAYTKALEEAAERAIAKYIQATQERPLPKQKIMELYGWKSDEKFYKERRKCGAEPVERFGNVDFFLPSQFLNPI